MACRWSVPPLGPWAFGQVAAEPRTCWPFTLRTCCRPDKAAYRLHQTIPCTWNGIVGRLALAGSAAIRYGIEETDVGTELCFRQDRPTHGLIEPTQAMTLQEFQDALARTRSVWKLHCR